LFRVWNANKAKEIGADAFAISVLLFSSFSELLHVREAFLGMSNIYMAWDILIVLYGITVLFTYTGFSAVARKLFEIADKIAGGFNYWRQWIAVVVSYFAFITGVIVFNTRPIAIFEGQMVYQTIAVVDVPLASNHHAGFRNRLHPIPLQVPWFVFQKQEQDWESQRCLDLHLLRAARLNRNVWRVVSNSVETIIVEFVLIDACACVLLLLFRRPNAVESIFMQLNIESVHVSTNEGSVLFSVVFIPGKVSQGNDELIGDLMKGLDMAVMRFWAMTR